MTRTHLIGRVIVITASLLSWYEPIKAAVTQEAPGSSWPMFRGDTSRTGFQSAESQLTPPLLVRWTALRGDPLLADTDVEIESSPVIANGKVYIIATIKDFKYHSGYDSSLVCLDLKTGQVLWQMPLGTEGIWSTPTLDGQDRIYVAAWDGRLYALNADTGQVLWSQVVAPGGQRALRASPLVINGRVYVGTFEQFGNAGHLYVLDGATGATLSQRTLRGGMFASPVIVGTNQLAVILNSDESRIVQVYDVSTDQLALPKWEKVVVGESAWFPSSTPAYANGLLFYRSGRSQAGVNEGWLYVLDAKTGADVIPPYRLPGSFWSSPALDASHLYVTGSIDVLYCFDMTRLLAGDPNPVLWTYKSRYGPIAASPAIANGFIYLSTDDTGSFDGAFFALDAATGNEVWHYEANQGVGSAQASPAVADGTVIFASYDDDQFIDHGVYAFRMPSPPVLSPIGNQTVNEGQPLTFTVSATDPDGDPLTLSARLANGEPLSAIGASFTDGGKGSGTFSWTPTHTQTGSTVLTVTVADAGGLSASQSVRVWVQPTSLVLAGHIQDHMGKPVPGVLVRLLGLGRYPTRTRIETLTDAQGRFQFTDLQTTSALQRAIQRCQQFDVCSTRYTTIWPRKPGLRILDPKTGLPLAHVIFDTARLQDILGVDFIAQ